MVHFCSNNGNPHVICTCADEEHVVRPLVQSVNPIHRQPREVDALGEQQGASQSFVLHQRVFLGKVERGVRQLQGAVVAVLPVWVSYTLQHRQRTERGNRGRKGMEERMKGSVRGPRRRKMKRRKLFSCSWHRLAWLVGFEMTALSPSPSLLFFIFLSLSLSPPPAITPLPLLPFLSSWIITFLAFRVMPAFAFSLLPLQYTTPTISTSLPLSFIIPPLHPHLSFCDAVVDKKTGVQNPYILEQYFLFLLPGVVWKYLHWLNIIYHMCQYRAPSFLPIQAVGQGRYQCSVPTFGTPPCTLCRLLQTPPSHHWSGTGTLPTHPHHPWNMTKSQEISDVLQ